MMPRDYRDGDGQSTITELHRQVSSVRLLLGTSDNQKSIPYLFIAQFVPNFRHYQSR